MSSAGVDAEVRSALAEVASAAGLAIDQSFQISALAGLAGPFITMDILGAGGSAGRCLAVRDAMSAGSEELLQSMLFVMAGDTPATDGAPAATGAELLGRFTGPVDVEALTDGQMIQAVVITAVERRQPPSQRPGPAPSAEAGRPAGLAGGLDKLSNVGLDVSVELGRTRVTLAEVLAFDVGSVVELDRPAGSPVDVWVNGTLLAQGEVVLVDDEYAVRITAIVDPRAER